MRVVVKNGEEWPGGSGVFHLTFFSGPDSTGRSLAVETPVPLGPRKRDQFSAAPAPKAADGAENSNIKYASVATVVVARPSFRMCQSSQHGRVVAIAIRWRRYVESRDFHHRVHHPDC